MLFIKSGSCTLKERKNFSEDVFKVEAGKIVKGTCSFYIDDFFDKKIINANIEVTNTAKRPMFCQYYVAFFDKDGHLIGCAGQGITGDEGLKPGQATQLGSCLIPLPPGTHEQVASYQVAFYESDVEVGK
ncbi:hypothetical protein HY256_06180 [Candidatus Sumerlaeota bacterium]|nr:hypothetical protein [Candidatus Sumerlaeota bacterium]